MLSLFLSILADIFMIILYYSALKIAWWALEAKTISLLLWGTKEQLDIHIHAWSVLIHVCQMLKKWSIRILWSDIYFEWTKFHNFIGEKWDRTYYNITSIHEYRYSWLECFSKVQRVHCVLWFFFKYRIGQLYMIAKHSHEQSEKGEGVEVIKNETCEHPVHGQGQFTEKRVHLSR